MLGAQKKRLIDLVDEPINSKTLHRRTDAQEGDNRNQVLLRSASVNAGTASNKSATKP